MGISAPGVGSGLDINSIISQLMAIERQPLQALKVKQKLVENQISAYGSLKGALSDFQSAMKGLADLGTVSSYGATSSNESVLSATLSTSAQQGSHSIVVNSLAKVDKLASSSYADANTDIGGTGTLTLTVNGSAMNVTVDATTNTLAEIRDAINNDSNNPGVTATIINESGGSRLVLTSDDTGAANDINVSFTDDDLNNTDNTGLSKLFFVGDDSADAFARNISQAVDASLTVDGFSVSSASNTVTGVIDGVSLNLKAEGTTTLSIASDSTAIEEKAQEFVDAYNNLMDTLEKYRDKGSELAADTTIRMIERQIKSIMYDGASIAGNPYSHLSHIGLEVDKYGTMSLDTGRLQDILDEDPAYVSGLFSDSTQGFAVRLEAYTDGLLASGGVLEIRTDGLNDRISVLEKQQERLEYRLELIEKRYLTVFTNMDTAIAGMQSTSSFLSSQMTSSLVTS